MQHLEEGTIHAWLDGALPPSEAEAVEAHVAQCAECAALVAEARGLIAGTSRIVSSLDHVPAGVVPKQPVQPSQSSLWHSLRLTPARASIAALILVGVASMFTARRGQLQIPSASSIRPDTPAIAAPTVSAPTPPPNVVARPETAVTTERAPQPPGAPRRKAAELAKPTAPVIPPPPAPATASAPAPTEMRAIAPAPEPSAVAGLAASKVAEAAATADSARARRDSTMAQRNFAGASAAAAQRVMRQTLDLPVSSPQGCYRLLTDSAGAIALPERFALQRDSVGRNVVLRLSPESRPAGTLDGFAWSQTSPTAARLTAPTTQLLLTTAESGRARLETVNRKAEVPLQRIPCRP